MPRDSQTADVMIAALKNKLRYARDIRDGHRSITERETQLVDTIASLQKQLDDLRDIRANADDIIDDCHDQIAQLASQRSVLNATPEIEKLQKMMGKMSEAQREELMAMLAGGVA